VAANPKKPHECQHEAEDRSDECHVMYAAH
jgi:hypothetical protein